ncbi:hypothetical protein FAIPA1_10063 [Frankia sp. AiPs1]
MAGQVGTSGGIARLVPRGLTWLSVAGVTRVPVRARRETPE